MGAGPLPRETQVTPSRSHQQAPGDRWWTGHWPQQEAAGIQITGPSKRDGGQGTGQAWGARAWGLGSCPRRRLWASVPLRQGSSVLPCQVPTEREAGPVHRCWHLKPHRIPILGPPRSSQGCVVGHELTFGKGGASLIHLCAPHSHFPPPTFLPVEQGTEKHLLCLWKDRNRGLPFFWLSSPKSHLAPQTPSCPT